MREKTAKYFNLLVVIIITNIQLSNASFSQVNVLPKEIFKINYLPLQDSLKELYGNNKTFIPKLELQALIALSHYPELKNIKINDNDVSSQFSNITEGFIDINSNNLTRRKRL